MEKRKKILIGIGASMGLLALIIGILFFFIREAEEKSLLGKYVMKRTKEECDAHWNSLEKPVFWYQVTFNVGDSDQLLFKENKICENEYYDANGTLLVKEVFLWKISGDEIILEPKPVRLTPHEDHALHVRIKQQIYHVRYFKIEKNGDLTWTSSGTKKGEEYKKENEMRPSLFNKYKKMQ